MSNVITANGTEVVQASSGQMVARVGETGELYLPVPGGFASLGLKPGSTVYISLSPPYANQAYGAVGQPPIIIVNSEPKKGGEKEQKKHSEVFTRI